MCLRIGDCVPLLPHALGHLRATCVIFGPIISPALLMCQPFLHYWRTTLPTSAVVARFRTCFIFPCSAWRDHIRQPLPLMDNNELAAHQRAMHALLDRVRYLEHATTLVMTHHRDSLRHARSRNGNHLARVRNLLSRIFVCTRQPTNGTRFIVLPSIPAPSGTLAIDCANSPRYTPGIAAVPTHVPRRLGPAPTTADRLHACLRQPPHTHATTLLNCWMGCMCAIQWGAHARAT